MAICKATSMSATNMVSDYTRYYISYICSIYEVYMYNMYLEIYIYMYTHVDIHTSIHSSLLIYRYQGLNHLQWVPVILICTCIWPQKTHKKCGRWVPLSGRACHRTIIILTRLNQLGGTKPVKKTIPWLNHQVDSITSVNIPLYKVLQSYSPILSPVKFQLNHH